MGATTVNGPAEAVDKALKGLLDLGVTALKALMASAAPWTQLPVIKQLIGWALDWVESNLYTVLAEDATYLVIKFETGIEKSNYLQTVADLKAAQLKGDPLLLKAAQLAFANAASALIHDDGSANP